jgi:predicted short-subunit dehydrogenase-like oxidoreductase (DUF2520 family)
VDMNRSIGIVGTGALARNLFAAFKRQPHYSITVYGRSKNDAKFFSEQFCPSLDGLLSCELIFLAVSDRAIEKLAHDLEAFTGILVHCSGATPILTNRPKTGVLYPLQSFSKEQLTDFSVVPLLVEGSTKEAENILVEIANNLSRHVERATSTERLKLHLAAVFAQNFSNHLIALAQEYVKGEGLNFTLLEPLLKLGIETAISSDAKALQSGPARRGDQITIDKHLNLLEKHKGLLHLYQTLSKSIEQTYEKNI